MLTSYLNIQSKFGNLNVKMSGNGLKIFFQIMDDRVI